MFPFRSVSTTNSEAINDEILDEILRDLRCSLDNLKDKLDSDFENVSHFDLLFLEH